jgi:hypothetical protein
MTVRPRRPRFGIRARLEHLVDTDERQQATVTIAFIVTIAAVILILVGAVGYGWYKDNLEPVGKVGNADIPPSLLKADIAFQTWRISRDEDRITQANVAQQIDNDTASTKTTDLETQASDLSTSAVDGLVDEMYQSQLAQGQGIGVSDADIDARYQQEVSDAEQRHVLVIAVAPTAADATNGPTYGERSAALDKITQALAAVTARAARTGRPSPSNSARTPSRSRAATWARFRSSRSPTPSSARRSLPWPTMASRASFAATTARTASVR